jgi:beta-galactosidase
MHRPTFLLRAPLPVDQGRRRLLKAIGILSAPFGLSACGGGGSSPSSSSSAAAPRITVAPADQSVIVGQTATFSVTATGTEPLNYQWARNSAVITGATSRLFSVAPTSISENGDIFTVTVGNSIGTAVSDPALLLVNQAPAIVAQPVDQSVSEGQVATFQVAVSGSMPLTFRWMRDGVEIAGASGDTLIISNTSAADDGDVFSVIVSNAVGSATSGPAVLTVNQAPAIVVQPNDQTVREGGSASFAVLVAGTSPINFQWQRDGIDIAGATAESYATGPVQLADDGSSFSVTATNIAGSTTSNAATLRVAPPPVTADSTAITVDSTDITVDSA